MINNRRRKLLNSRNWSNVTYGEKQGETTPYHDDQRANKETARR